MSEPCKLCGGSGVVALGHPCLCVVNTLRLRDDVPQAVASYGIIDPDYARVFTMARVVAWQFGFACLFHGSFTRDLDLLLVPWTENACAPVEPLVRRIADVAGLTLQGPPSAKPHGRQAWSLLFPGFNDPRWVDISAFDFPKK